MANPPYRIPRPGGGTPIADANLTASYVREKQALSPTLTPRRRQERRERPQGLVVRSGGEVERKAGFDSEGTMTYGQFKAGN